MDLHNIHGDYRLKKWEQEGRERKNPKSLASSIERVSRIIELSTYTTALFVFDSCCSIMMRAHQYRAAMMNAYVLQKNANMNADIIDAFRRTLFEKINIEKLQNTPKRLTRRTDRLGHNIAVKIAFRLLTASLYAHCEALQWQAKKQHWNQRIFDFTTDSLVID